MRSLVYEAPVESTEEPLARTLVVCDIVRNTPGLFDWVVMLASQLIILIYTLQLSRFRIGVLPQIDAFTLLHHT